jgi:hypothetical protein
MVELVSEKRLLPSNILNNHIMHREFRFYFTVPENKDVWNKGLNNVKEHLKAMGRARQATPQAAPPNRYCACSNLMCNCCRDFSLPVVPIKGPGKQSI